MSAAAQPAPSFKKTSFGVTVAEGNIRAGNEMLKEAGADFEVKKVPVKYPVPVEKTTPGGEKYTEMEDHYMKACAVVRSDTGLTINDNQTVSDGFTVVQNSEVIDIIDAICQGHDLQYRYMTLLNEGRGLIVQVYSEELNKSLSVGDDRNDGLLTISNFHDGTGALKVHVSLKRVFCQNVLPALNREHRTQKRNGLDSVYSIRHSRNMEMRINEMVNCYREAMGDLETTAEKLRLLANVKCKKSEMDELFERIVNADGKSEAELTSRAKAQRESKLEAIRALRNDPKNKVADAPGTWYEALQPVTAYGTRGIRVRNTGRVSQNESRFTSAYFGAGARLSMLGLETALEMAGV